MRGKLAFVNDRFRPLGLSECASALATNGSSAELAPARNETSAGAEARWCVPRHSIRLD
jgi:hypothetical protein